MDFNKRRESRDWCGTDYSPVHWLKLPDGVKYMVWQLERCPTTDRPHHQIYVELTKFHRQSWVLKNISSTGYWRPRFKTPEQAALYCKKKDTRMDGPFELGKIRDFRKGSGLRTDLENFRDAIWKGKRKLDLMETDIFMIAKYPRLYHEIDLAKRPHRTIEMEVILGIGDTRMGKSRWGFDQWEYNNSYWQMPINNGKLWFDGYDKHQIAQIDDFCGRMSCCRLDMILKILDRYPIMVPVKNSHAWWMPNIVYLTSNIWPVNWYAWEKREKMRDALQARFTKVLDFNHMTNGKPQELDLATWDWEDQVDNGQIKEGNRIYGEPVPYM